MVTFKKTTQLILLALLTLGVLPATAGCVGDAHAEEQLAGDAFLSHVMSGPAEPQRALMGLMMAKTIAATGRDVAVFLDDQGVEFGVDGGAEATFMDWESSTTLVGELLAMDVPIYVCPRCLDAAGYSEADLLDGVRLATPDVFFEFTDAARIVTMDH